MTLNKKMRAALADLRVVDLIIQMEDFDRSCTRWSSPVARVLIERENKPPFLLVAVLGAEAVAELDAAHRRLVNKAEENNG